MHWIYLILSIGFEVAGTTCMKLSEGFSKTLPSVLVAVFYIACFTLLTLALKKMELSMAYAIWAGLGTALITGVGIVFFHEPVSVLKMGSVGLIILGVIGLRLGGGH